MECCKYSRCYKILYVIVVETSCSPFFAMMFILPTHPQHSKADFFVETHAWTFIPASTTTYVFPPMSHSLRQD
jgi:hypothetical protein